MSLLFETIRIENGNLRYPEEHEERMYRSRKALFGVNDRLLLNPVISIPPEFSSGIVRCRVDYGLKIDSITFTHYRIISIRTFKVIENDRCEYPYKFTDRSALDSLLKDKKTADEIILVKEGMITDTSFSNLIFYDGKKWVTPSAPMLYGTCRARLLREGKISEKKIFLKDLFSFRGIKIINAMIYPEDMEMVRVSDCIIL